MGGAIFSILLVSIITNITLFNEFDLYMRNEQESRLNEVIQLIEQSYALNNGWDNGVINNISISPLIDNYDIEIKDLYNRTIFTHYMESTIVRLHNEMMQRMGSGMGRNQPHRLDENPRDENYTVEEYDLLSDNEVVGSVAIGHVGPFVVSEREIEFTKGINLSIFFGALISIVIAILLGVYSSKIFSTPIINITKAANKIRQGDLDTKVEVDNGIIELQELSNSINHLSKSLSEQELLRKRLTSDISHELRTPLTILQSHIEAISDGVWEPTQEKMNICKNEVVRLIKLVDELRHLTDIEKHKLKLDIQKYPLTHDLEEIKKSFSHQFHEKGIKVRSNIGKNIFLHGDRDKIKQVVINILSNALKFTNPGGEISINLLDQKEQVQIIIEDTGIGIEKQDIPYIFERFYKTDQSRNRKNGGIGIGLAITKSLIEAHGGRIKVESEKNKGTKFIIALPKDKKE